MTTADIAEFKKIVARRRKDIGSSRAKSLSFMQAIGVLNAKGEIKSAFRAVFRKSNSPSSRKKI